MFSHVTSGNRHWSRRADKWGCAPAALIRTSILPAVTRGLGTSTSFRAPYPVNDSAHIALIIAPPHACSLARIIHRIAASRPARPVDYSFGRVRGGGRGLSLPKEPAADENEVAARIC